jgi:hypothetical protein
VVAAAAADTGMAAAGHLAAAVEVLVVEGSEVVVQVKVETAVAATGTAVAAMVAAATGAAVVATAVEEREEGHQAAVEVAPEEAC